MNTIFLLSKDCMSLESLPCYGGCQYWQGKTPNIDLLVEKGTIFRRHYTAAPSTSMAMSAMLTGHYPYEFESRKQYIRVKPSEFPSIFDELQQQGFECHMIWDKTWINMAWKFVREFGDETKTVFHNLDIAQPTFAHKKGDIKLNRDDELLKKTLNQVFETIDSIDYSKKQFVWLHLPHILKGRRSYMDDMDVFDDIVGYVRGKVGDENLFITSDHGHMNMHKHKLGYGFDVYEPAIRIPLITPRIEGVAEVESLTSNIDLPQILINRTIPRNNEFVVSDTKYYAQPKRKLSITGKRFKYIYNADGPREEFYDLDWDPQENFNILEELFLDIDRKKMIFATDQFFYPYYEEAMEKVDMFRKIRESLWRNPSFKERVTVNGIAKLAKIKRFLHI